MELLYELWGWLNNFDSLILTAVVSVGIAFAVVVLVGVLIVGIFAAIWAIAQATVLNPAFWVLVAIVGGFFYFVDNDRSWLGVDPEFIEACSGNEACNRELRRIDKARPTKESDMHLPLEPK